MWSFSPWEYKLDLLKAIGIDVESNFLKDSPLDVKLDFKEFTAYLTEPTDGQIIINGDKFEFSWDIKSLLDQMDNLGVNLFCSNLMSTANGSPGISPCDGINNSMCPNIQFSDIPSQCDYDLYGGTKLKEFKSYFYGAPDIVNISASLKFKELISSQDVVDNGFDPEIFNPEGQGCNTQ